MENSFGNTVKTDKSLWTEIAKLMGLKVEADLGFGFPNYTSLPSYMQMVMETTNDSNPLLHQYTRVYGHVRLVNVLAKLYSIYLNRTIDPLNEMLITNGANNGLFVIIGSILREPTDEIVVIEPFYRTFVSAATFLNRKVSFVQLRPSVPASKNATVSSSDWTWNEAELENAFNSNTRLVVLNTPSNPLGKVHNEKDLNKIAELCKKHNCLCLSDEVYHNMIFDSSHIRMATLPGMWERTITIGSLGKMLSATHIKLGYIIAPVDLMEKCRMTHTDTVYTVTTFFQEVAARCLEYELARLNEPQSYFKTLQIELKQKRDRLAKIFSNIGLTPVIPEGGYFMMIDISRVDDRVLEGYGNDSKDLKVLRYLIKEKVFQPFGSYLDMVCWYKPLVYVFKSVSGFPGSAFFSEKHSSFGEKYIRLCIFKSDDVLEKVANALKNIPLTPEEDD